MAICFCETLEKEGYYVSIYGSDISTFKERLETERLEKYDKWVAKYSKSKPTFIKSWGIWQQSSSGSVPGITGPVDMDVSVKDYQSIMLKHNLNRG